MGYRMTAAEFDGFLKKAAQTYDVWGPAAMPRSGRYSDQKVLGYRKVDSSSELVLDSRTYFSPKEILFPVRESLLEFTDGRPKEPEMSPRPVLLFLRACEIHGIDRLDTVFLRNGPATDYYYARRRERVKLVLIECPSAGFNSCFCVSMGTNSTDEYAMAIRSSGGTTLVAVKDESLMPLMEGVQDLAEFTPEFVRENLVKVRVPEPGTVTPDFFEDPLWKDYTRRCIGCGRCNTSCVTCSCFNMQDVAQTPEKPAARRRIWTGCHLDKFTAMAGGHEFRREYGDRMRFKALHKVNDFHRRFGKHMCVGCGRCEDVCPEYISFAHCINLLSGRVEAKEKKP